MDLITHHFWNILAIDYATLAVLCVLCGLASYFIKEYLANPPMIVFVYPVLVVCSILSHYSFVLLELYPSNKMDQWLMWTIMAAICGTIAGICIVTGAAVAKDGLSAPRS